MIPYRPSVSIFPNTTSAPRTTSPVLINNSVRMPGFSQPGVPIRLLTTRPITRAHRA